MPNVTIHIDDETHRIAKVYVATHGTSMSRLFRDHIRSLAAADDARRTDPLARYAEGQISAKEAMDGLGLTCTEDLYHRMAERKLALPRMDDTVARQLVKPVVSLLLQQQDKTATPNNA